MPDLLHSIQITDPDYERAAIQWKTDFLFMPFFACEEALKYMQGMPGVTAPTKLPSVEGAGQFAPYRRDRRSASATKAGYREITSYLGNVREDFEPLEIIQTLLGRGTATLGDTQMQAPSARLVIAAVICARSDTTCTRFFSPPGATPTVTRLPTFSTVGEISAQNFNKSLASLRCSFIFIYAFGLNFTGNFCFAAF